MSYFPSMSSLSSYDDEFSSGIKFKSIKSTKAMVEEGIENRGTFSEKVGKAVVWVFSGSYNLISSGCRALNEWVFTPILDHALRPLMNTVYNVFEAIFTGLSDVGTFLIDWIGQPLMDNVFTPFSTIASNAFESMKTNFANIGRTLNEWIFTPFAEHVLPPLQNVIAGIFDLIETGFTALNEWAFTPLAEHVLTPLFGEISRLFNFIKTSVSTAATSLNERVFTPLYDAVLEPALELIKTYASPALTTLNDWTFKPLYNSLSDIGHGIFIGAVAGDEADLEELQVYFDEFLEKFDIKTDKTLDEREYTYQILKESYEHLINDSNQYQTYTAQFHEGRNSAMALYLAHSHSLVIEHKWIESERSCPELINLFKEKAQLDRMIVDF